MCVQDGGGEYGEFGALECEYGSQYADDDEVTQQPREDADVAPFEDPVLVDEGGERVLETESKGVPAARLDPGDDEVIEVDQDTGGDRVRDEDERGDLVFEEDDRRERVRYRRADDERDGSVVFRVDRRSPVLDDDVEVQNRLARFHTVCRPSLPQRPRPVGRSL